MATDQGRGSDAPPALVALLHAAGPVYRRVVEAVTTTEPVLDFIGPGRRRQTVWRVPAGAATDELVTELQRIDAVGAQNARLAEAIALAQQRIVVLDRRR